MTNWNEKNLLAQNCNKGLAGYFAGQGIPIRAELNENDLRRNKKIEQEDCFHCPYPSSKCNGYCDRIKKRRDLKTKY